MIFFLLLMSFYFLPKILHEVLGIAIFAAGILHLYFNRAWFKGLIAGKYNFVRVLRTITNFSLIILFTIVTITGICLSNFLFPDFIPFEFRRNITIHQYHVALPYLTMIFLGIHIGLHFKNLLRRFTNFFGIDETDLKFEIAAGFLAIIVFGAGIYGSFLNRVGDRILMYHVFGTPALDLPFAGFVGIIFCGIAIYALITILILKKFF